MQFGRIRERKTSLLQSSEMVISICIITIDHWLNAQSNIAMQPAAESENKMVKARTA